jgi:hypothetical protein
MATVCRNKETVARKRHLCYWCGEPICVGEKYASWTWIDDCIETIRVHMECRDAWHRAACDQSDIYYECGHGEHCRGCTCERGRCECGAAKLADSV